MASRYDAYRIRNGDDIGDPEFWNRRFKDVDARIGGVEEQKATLDAVIDEGRTVFRTRVDQILVPLVAEVVAVADLGALLRVHSATTVEISLGGKTLVVDEAERLRFAAPSYLTVAVTGDVSRAMAGRLVSYDKATGEVVVDVDQVVGEGAASDWTISVGTLTDAAADKVAAQAARLGAVEASVSANEASGLAVASRDQAALSAAATAAARAVVEAGAVAVETMVATLSAIDHLYCGAGAVAPTTLSDGSPLVTGAEWLDTSTGTRKQWIGGAWTEIYVPSSAAVVSFNGRTGAVGPASGDYTAAQVSRTAGASGIAAATAEAALVEIKGTADAKAPAARTIIAAGLAQGGGSLAADRTIMVPKSSQAQAQAGTDDTTAMTPARVADAIVALTPAVPDASTTTVGKARLATTVEATTGAAVDIAITPAGLKAATDAMKSALLNGAGGAFDTLSELAAALGNDANFAVTVSGQIAAKLDLSATSAWARGGLISASDQTAARTYLGLGSAALAAASTFAAAVHGHTIGDVTGLQTALDAKLAAGSYTAADVLAKLLGVDGAGSGLDADKVRGQAPGTMGLSLLTTADRDAALAALAISTSLVPAGQVGLFAMSTPPSGWLKANGALVSRTTYAALFAAIGTTWGAGDGSTTFALPDLRGEFLRGLDDGRGVDTSRALGSAQAGQNATHTHSIDPPSATTSSDAHTHTVPSRERSTYPLSGGYQASTNSNNYAGTTSNPMTTSSDSHAHTVNVGSFTSGASGGTEARSRNVALLACIKY